MHKQLEDVKNTVQNTFHKMLSDAKEEAEANTGEEDGEEPGKRVGTRKVADILKINDHIKFYESDAMLLRMSRLFPNNILMIVNVKTIQSAMDPTDRRSPTKVMIDSFLESMIAFKGMGKTEKTQDLAVVARSLLDESRDSFRADGLK